MPCLVHGDFYDKQVVLCDPELDANERVGIIDLDELRLGDRREDLALCRAHWERDALLHQLERDPAALGDALLEGYRRHAVGALPSLDVFVAAGLFRLAPHPFRTRTRDWQAHVEALLLRTSEILEQAE
jgi:aminoglycoside phosphotransferase (APT) family kinase protein